MRNTNLVLVAGIAAAFATQAQAAESESCRTVTFSDVGWTDITATTATASVILGALGYETDTVLLSIPVTYASMKNADVDVYLGDWQPSMLDDRQPYLDDESIEVVSTNLEGAKYTFAVPTYVHEAGVSDFADLQEHAEAFGRQIYGIEPGNNGNRMILDMIEDGAFGLSDWTLVESSEQGMLSAVDRAVRNEEWVVFLGWEPHPMNSRYDIEYLAGGDDYFGPDFGGATVHTNIRAGYGQECPNVTAFVSNLKFTLEMENDMMGAILDDGKDPQDAAREWLQANPEAIDPWLEGVTTIDGGDADAAVRQVLGP